MKRALLYGFWTIVAGCVLIPIAYSCDFGKYVTMVTTMLSGLCGLGTLYIAILLYDRYGVETKTGEQILKAVNQVIVEFQKVTFVLCSYTETKEDETLSTCVIDLTIQSSKDFVIDNLTDEALSSVLYYKDSGMYGCVQLTQNTLKNVYLPKSIAEEIKKLYIFKYETSNLEEKAKPITTLSAFSDKLSALQDKLDASDTRIPENQLSVIQFLDAYFGIKDAIIKWYKENNLDITKLNLDYSSNYDKIA